MRFGKKLAALFMAALLMITSFPAEFIAPMTAYAEEVTKLTVTGDVVNIRSGAGTSYSKVTTVTQSTVLTSQGTAKDAAGVTWYKVTVNGSTGYIVSTYVSASTTSSSTQTLTVTGTTVYVRKGAGTSYDYITTVKKGASYKVMGSTKGSDGKVWYKISINNTTGYIISTYVKVAETGSTTASTNGASSTTTAAVQRQLKVTGDIVNVRKGAGTNTAKVTTVKQNAVYLIQGTGTDSDGKTWYKISVNGTVGYVISTYVTVSDVTTTTTTTTTTAKATETTTTTTTATTTTTPALMITTGASATQPTPAPTTVYTGTTLPANIAVSVAADGTEMRSGAGVHYSLMASLKKGTVVTILSNRTDSEGNLWYRVMYAAVSGYVKAGDIDNGSQAQTTTTTKTTTVPNRGTTTTTKSTTRNGTTTSFRDGLQLVVTTTTKRGGDSAQSTLSTTSSQDISEMTTTNNSTDTRVVRHGTVKCDTSLRVRRTASTSAETLGTIRNGTQVVIVETLSGWYKIEYNNGYGYVSSDFIVDVKDGTVTISLAFGKAYYYVNQGAKINVAINLANYVISYSSESDSAAPVSKDGVVTGNAPGVYTITATVGGATATTEVVVLKKANTGIQPMTISDKGTKFIADWEGGGTPFGDAVVFYPYQDAAGYWTVGYGHAITTAESKQWTREQAIEQFNKEILALLGEGHEMTAERPYLTQEEATALLNADLNKGPYVTAVSDWAVRNGVKLTQNQFDALVSFCFNLGPNYWTSDTYYFYLKSAIISHRDGSAAKSDQIIDGFTRYIKAGGKNLKGLWWRRRNEAEMFINGDYAIDRENKFTLPNISWA